MRLADFDYELPTDRIAQQPAEPRDIARLLVLDRRTGSIAHRIFRDLPELLAPGDLLVLNDTRVIPARLRGRKEGTGGRAEVLLVWREVEGMWRALVGARRARPGTRITLAEGHLRAELLERREDGTWRIALQGDVPPEEVIQRWGEVPLPPYIRERPRDPEVYQTVYARSPGAVAAPTAGLHFTPQLLERLRARGILYVFLTLHVGPGTFRPITAEDPTRHRMDAEPYEVPPQTAEAIRQVRARGNRVVAVGTTVVRALETAAQADGMVRAGAGWTDLYIYPGYRFRVVDALVTNFHLPRSTPLVLVSAFARRERVLEAYREALAEGYRFGSFGDAMLLL
ncbi:MAG: tRNA preQ1(34) S-adenosylmethionine ribosyltransferase-isomerase QueA [Armatimonadota bacterium]|nr:tRNA preQ1(34) S-adenosylmethionine ribosyltransferase-isomerase QueA [Armatimonadota bacterium]MDR7439068.1 tRNA preQ1(34) S-adenosylmethionine ribosyltransferase-isomerase QueA [Armatimonadota bacterium]MDR7562995.1 tRNA preQ1(34) S-adenosylmethionine ribosyltransferase-isomerase QueA [Armatimonadota bacterium]MDR7568922.1 tRNA preQ1(34) S-adenosylmethionine ribosyltransferase-isomerase QueA [Armatimonadota bacterium]MDR7600839.1 tRNA preQ1(34) S-adenosylmethionine ribosyltransferase-isome